MPQNRNALIVLCAGLGKRMGATLPKMLIPIAKKPLLYWTLSRLEKCSTLHGIVLAVPSDYLEVFKKNILKWKLKKIIAVVPGGTERTDSTRNALKVIPSQYQIIGIHDGARPFVDSQLIQNCYAAAEKNGAAILAVPVKETIKVTLKNNMIQKTIPRHQCWAAQTPQVFKREIVEKIHGKNFRSSQAKNIFTDDASIAESMGYPVKIVQGSYENIKVTTPEDLWVAERLVRRKQH